MQLGTRARYAVMAMVDLARHVGGGPVALADIAARQCISLPYLVQLFRGLRRSGLVDSVRGPGGGYLLGRDPSLITISAIVAAVDEAIRATACTPGGELSCRGQGERCAAHDLWRLLDHQIVQLLSHISLADVAQRRLGQSPPCTAAVPPGATLAGSGEPLRGKL